MIEGRTESYARLLVERGIKVRPGWQVIIRTNPLARPLVEEVARQLARRGAYALLRISYGAPHMNLIAVDTAWALSAPEDLLQRMPPIERDALETADAMIIIEAPDDRESEAAEGLIARRHLLRRSVRPLMERLQQGDLPTAYCLFPTEALALQAGMALGEYEDFLYAACLLDWEREAGKMRDIAALFDGQETVRILGEGTDLTLSFEDCRGKIDDGRETLPGGRVYYRPVEGSADGYITFGEFPIVYRGSVVEGARLEFRDGRVTQASARHDEDTLLETLGAGTLPWSLREIGIGCNPAVRRHTRNTLFDQKIDGTLHLELSGDSPAHAPWVMVKPFGVEGRLEAGGRVVYPTATSAG